ncbi:uncharacterized protein [Amphiura filiformis]|uniref:uncharacterized protein n=1 Tax=Amphiura filiformis TaxID=82378 RepID=UPI003B20BEFC
MSPTPGIPICLILILICYQAAALHKTICDDMCHCHDNEVDCSAQLGDLHDLHELTANIPNDTDTLDVSSNQIEFIGDAFYHLPVLQKLNVANNKIATQYGLPSSLTGLYGQNNKLTDIFGMFNNTTNLEIVDLTNNQISSIQNGTFFNCGRLVELTLSGNPLTQLYDGAFTGLSHLLKLYLRDVHLKSLHKESLKGLPRVLWEFVIRAPYLCYIEPGLFDFTTLSFSSISSDCLRNLSGRIFSAANNSYVGSIHIEFTPLQEISQNAFDGISSFFWTRPYKVFM